MKSCLRLSPAPTPPPCLDNLGCSELRTASRWQPRRGGGRMGAKSLQRASTIQPLPERRAQGLQLATHHGDTHVLTVG